MRESSETRDENGTILASKDTEISSTDTADHGDLQPSLRDLAEGYECHEWVGALVEVPGGWYGHVRYIGPVEDKTGVFVGVELVDSHATYGRNDGSIGGVRYFSTRAASSGVFTGAGKCKVFRQLHENRSSVATRRAISPLSLQSKVCVSRYSPDFSSEFENLQAEYQNLQIVHTDSLSEIRLLRHDRTTQREELAEIAKKVEDLSISIRAGELTTLAVAEDYQLANGKLLERDKKIDFMREEAEDRRREFCEAVDILEKNTDESRHLFEFQSNELQDRLAEAAAKFDSFSEASARERSTLRDLCSEQESRASI